MAGAGAIRQVLEDVRRTRFMPQSRSERVALISDSIARVIPYQNSAWLYLDSAGGLVDCITYPHCYPELQRIYATELHASPERTGFLPWKTLLRVVGVFDMEELSMGLVYRSEFYRRCMEPVGLYAGLCMPLIDPGGRPYGLLTLGRPPGEKFVRQEHRILSALQSEIGAASAGGLGDAPTDPDFVLEEEGILVIRRDGTLVHSDLPGRKLLWLASHPYLDETLSARDDEGILLARLAQIGCQALLGSTGSVIQTPEERIAHDRGQYDFRVHLLEPESGLFGVLVRRSTSRLNRIAKRLMGLQAGPRQKDIAILLARGFTYPEVALELGVSVSSVVTQVRLLFQKLSVNSREDLVVALGRQQSIESPNRNSSFGLL